MRKTAFKITRKRDGVFLTEETSDGNNRTRVSDPIRVRSIGIRLADKVTFVEIRFKTIHGDRQSKTFPFSYLQRKRWGDLQFELAIRATSGPKTRVLRMKSSGSSPPSSRSADFSWCLRPDGMKANLCCRVKYSARQERGRTTASIPKP